jgi:hypothetical protein
MAKWKDTEQRVMNGNTRASTCEGCSVKGARVMWHMEKTWRQRDVSGQGGHDNMKEVT